MRKRTTVLAKLFFNYALVIIPVVIVLFLAFFAYVSSFLTERASESIYQLSSSISAQIDAKFQTMNTISMNIVFSDTLRKLIFNDSSQFQSTNIALQRLFNEYVFMIRGPDDLGILQINIVNSNGNFAAVGYECFMDWYGEDVAAFYPNFEEAISLDGNKYISQPYRQTLTRTKNTVISLCRSFSEEYAAENNAIVDIQLNYRAIADIAASAGDYSGPDEPTDVMVFNDSGLLIYPLDADSIYSEYWDAISRDRAEQIVTTQLDGEPKKMLASVYSDYTGFTVVTAKNEADLIAPVIQFRKWVSLLGFTVLVLILLISFFAARGIANPIKKIHRKINNLRLDDLPGPSDEGPGSNILEIEELNRQFDQMCLELKASLENVVSARSMEIQARMLALQSQMNPHFLYNTLAVINIMGKEAGENRIVEMCNNLTAMLRYISVSETQPVRLSREIDYTMSYIKLMKVRYPDRLEVRIDIPEELEHVMIPRLMIQPLVENALKYGIDVYPPWIITIKGNLTADGWSISVTDNGKGFSDEALAALYKKKDEYDTGSPARGLSLDGMGLINIYVRLKLFYNDKTIYRAENLPGGGAAVTIGGSLQHFQKPPAP